MISIRRLLLLTLLGHIGLPSALAAAQQQTQQQAQTYRLVVLPFENLTRQATDDWLGLSFAESLTGYLSLQPELMVIERAQMQQVIKELGFAQSQFADTENAPELGKLVGARQLLLGSFQREGQHLLVRARLVDASSGQVLNYREIRGAESQLQDLQHDLASGLISDLNLRQPVALNNKTSGTLSQPAYQAYHQALYQLERDTTLDFERVMALLKQAIAADPNFTLAYTALAEAYAKRSVMGQVIGVQTTDTREQDLAEALRYAETALRQGREPAAVYRVLASIYLVRQEPDKARQAIEASLKLEPGNIQSLIAYIKLQPESRSLAEIQADLSRFQADLSNPWLRFAVLRAQFEREKQQLHPNLAPLEQELSVLNQELTDYPELSLMRIEVAVARDNLNLAWQVAQDLQQRYPDAALVQLMLGLLFLNAPDYRTQARQWIEHALALRPNFSYGYTFLGMSYYQSNEVEKAKALLLQARRLNPESSIPPLFLGIVALEQADYAEARAYYLQAQSNQVKMAHIEKINPVDLSLGLAQSHAMLQEVKAAEGYYQQALNYPSDLKRWRQASRLYLTFLKNQGDYARALSHFETHTQRVNGDYTPAEAQVYREIVLLKSLPDSQQPADVLNDLGQLALLQKNYLAAAHFFKQALQKKPAYTPVLFNQGLLRLAQAQPQQAQALFEQVLLQEPHHFKARFNLGKALAQQQQTQRAREIWQTLLLEQPQQTEILQALENLP